MEQKKPVIAGAAILLCAALYYFLYFVRTPEYSLNLIREAVQKHDMIAFERHVDTDHICNKLVDDYMVALSQKENNPMAIGLMNMMKPALVAHLKEAVLEAARGEGQEPTKTQNKEIDEMTEALKDNIYNDMKFKSASVIYKDGSEAVVAIALVHPDYNRPVELKVRMVQLDSGKWRVKEIANLMEFLGETKRVADAIEKKAETKKPTQNNKSASAKSGKHLSYQEAADVWAAQNKSPDGSEVWEYYVVRETCAKQSATQYSGTYKVVYSSGKADVLPAIFYFKDNAWYEVRAGWGEKRIRQGSAIEKVLEVIKEYAE